MSALPPRSPPSIRSFEYSYTLNLILTDYAGPIATAISQRYQPLYTEATPAEWQHLSTLMRQKKLPGRKVGGLLPAQKHAAAACVRSLKHQGWVDLIGEMGTGVR